MSWGALHGDQATQSPPESQPPTDRTQELESQVYEEYFLVGDKPANDALADSSSGSGIDSRIDVDSGLVQHASLSGHDSYARDAPGQDDDEVHVASSAPTMEPAPTSPVAKTPLPTGRKRDRAGNIISSSVRSTPASAEPVSLSKMFGAAQAPQLTQMFNMTQADSSPGAARDDLSSSPVPELPAPYNGRAAGAFTYLHNNSSPFAGRKSGNTGGAAAFPSSVAEKPVRSTARNARHREAQPITDEFSPPASMLGTSPQQPVAADSRTPLAAFKTPGRSVNAPIVLSSDVKQSTRKPSRQVQSTPSEQPKAHPIARRVIEQGSGEQTPENGISNQVYIPSSPFDARPANQDESETHKNVRSSPPDQSRSSAQIKGSQGILAPSQNRQNVPPSLQDSLPDKARVSDSSGRTEVAGNAIPETSPASRTANGSQVRNLETPLRAPPLFPRDLSPAQDAQPADDDSESGSDSSELSDARSSVSPPRPSMSQFTDPSSQDTSGRAETALAISLLTSEKPQGRPVSRRKRSSLPEQSDENSSTCNTPRKSERQRKLDLDKASHVRRRTFDSTSTLPTRTTQENKFPFRVLAHFSGFTSGPKYYAASITTKEPGEDGKYIVRFDDEPDKDEPLAKHRLCPLDLQVGDQVRIDRNGHRNSEFVIRSLKVQNDTRLSQELSSIRCDSRGHGTVTCEKRHAQGAAVAEATMEEVLDVDVSEIYVTSTRWPMIQERTSNMSMCPMDVLPRGALQAWKPEDNTKITPETGLFSGMAFAVSGLNGDHLNRVEEIICRHGGALLDDGFKGLFDVDRAHSSMTASAKSEGLGFAALVSDEHSRTAKYLQALALNVPCLSTRFVLDCNSTGTMQPWSRYLLPAGVSEALGGAVRSRTLLGSIATDARHATFGEMVKARAQPFAGRRIGIVYPQGSDKTVDDARELAFFAKAMGAESVDKVAGLAGVNARAWDLICAVRVSVKDVRRQLRDKGTLVLDKDGLLEVVVLGDLQIS